MLGLYVHLNVALHDKRIDKSMNTGELNAGKGGMSSRFYMAIDELAMRSVTGNLGKPFFEASPPNLDQ